MFVCTFLGHKEVYDKDIYEKLARAVYGLVEEHDEAEFLFYNQGTFYDLCLAAVLEARQRFPQKRISITWVVPAEERERWQRLLDACDYETMVQDHYSPGCMMRRNRYMVDHAALLIAVYDGQSGGTRRTVEYALRRQIPVVLVPPEEE